MWAILNSPPSLASGPHHTLPAVINKHNSILLLYLDWTEASPKYVLDDFPCKSLPFSSDFVSKYLSDTWIGLYDDVNSWRWSFHDEHLTYARWDKYQPDNYGGDQDCVILHSNGYWRDKGCDLKYVFWKACTKTFVLRLSS
uniref:C-type lectin domain-containing protein n=1 Tax=Cyprinus carpio TaxID=7962 RepID=A0A8C1ZZK9_CYPCA